MRRRKLCVIKFGSNDNSFYRWIINRTFICGAIDDNVFLQRNRTIVTMRWHLHRFSRNLGQHLLKASLETFDYIGSISVFREASWWCAWVCQDVSRSGRSTTRAYALHSRWSASGHNRTFWYRGGVVMN